MIRAIRYFVCIMLIISSRMDSFVYNENFIGCFEDNYQIENLEVSKCICNSKYKGLLNGVWCLCLGEKYLDNESVSNNRCGPKCGGTNKYCGSKYYTAVYMNEGTYVGCFKDSASDSQMSLKWCEDYCKNDYYGLLNGVTCFCYESYINLVSSRGCTKTCSIDGRTLKGQCGGNTAVSIYRTESFSSAPSMEPEETTQHIPQDTSISIYRTEPSFLPSMGPYVPSQPFPHQDTFESLLLNLKDIFITNEFDKIYLLLKTYNSSLDSCLMNCSNHGICTYENNEIVCSCDEFYRGEACEEDTRPCSKQNTCLNGNCTDLIVGDQVRGYNCNCHELYEGRHCQYKKKVCDGFNCGNGLCIPLTESSVKCLCFMGYTGQYCDLKQGDLKKRDLAAKSVTIASVLLIAFFLSLLFLIDGLRFINWFMKT